VRELLTGVKYVITDLGTTDQVKWNAVAGTTGVFYSVDNTFTATTGTGTTSTVGLVTTSLDTDTEIVSARIHESVYNQVIGKTTIYLVDYYGNFENKFHSGTFYVKPDLTETSASVPTLSINNVSTDVVYGKYAPYTGEVLHYVDFDPITREVNRKEKIKFIFDF
jgi:hypothetical protein